ncbi:MAG: chemotaxis protein CheA [Oleiphilaceae bacterium]|nr:chemotaxis protein CheA [Oleiphilaceae bacterium]
MTIDLSQFHQVFFDECHEGLDAMESALLNFEVANPDSESINGIFRAAHSIKGGSGTFGFHQIADFTHVLESMLDKARAGEFSLTKVHVELLLRAVDCVRRMVAQLEAGEVCETAQAEALKQELELVLIAPGDQQETSQQPAPPSNTAGTTTAPADQSEQGWQIYFRPDENVLRTGNEPLRMFRELAEMGQLSVSAFTDDLPDFDDLEPQACYLTWELTLWGDVDEADIQEVFEWVADEAEITITPLLLSHDVIASNSAETRGEPEPRSTSRQTTPEPTASTQPVKAPEEPPKAAKKELKQDLSSIRVSTEKVDGLINMVGELVITQSMLGELGAKFEMKDLPRLLAGLEQLSAHTRALQENVMRIRMLPISFAFSRFPRLVHDISNSLGKQVELELVGEQTELDKTVLERIVDPLVHLVRNSLDHGLETPEERRAAGKDETGKITLKAYHQGGNIVIEIIDDGAGLNRDRILSIAQEKGLVKNGEPLSDEQIDALIFKPGFSTASEVTDISGRGVGMDVVRRNIQELNGTVEVQSQPGIGSRFSIRLPLTLAILDGQLVRIAQQCFVIPLVSIVESLELKEQTLHHLSDEMRLLRLRDEFLPIIELADLFNITGSRPNAGLLVVVESAGRRVALKVDDLLGQQQVVIKSLEENYRAVEGVSGATILGDGTVSLILDVTGVVRLASDTSDTGATKLLGDDTAAA